MCLVSAIKTRQKAGKKVSRIALNVAGHATFREDGQLFFLSVLEKGLEFPTPAADVGATEPAETKEEKDGEGQIT